MTQELHNLARPRRVLIVNADDFGMSTGVNRGIVKSHEHGIVTSASLMTRWPAATEAAEYGRAHPQLSVGLHFELAEWVYRNHAWEQLYQVIPSDDADAVKAELERQLADFRRLMGRDPTHLDSHQHLHQRDPTKSIMMDCAQQIGVPLRSFTPSIQYCHQFAGQTQRGEPYAEGISVANLVKILSGLPAGVTELGCHPGDDAALNSVYRLERQIEVATLCDSAVREVIVREAILLSSFAVV